MKSLHTVFRYSGHSSIINPLFGSTGNPFDRGQLGPDEVNGEPIDSHMEWLLTWPLNLTGQPAASVPAGLSDDGLPIGAQLIVERFGEETILTASAAVERCRPWSGDYPSL